MKNILSVINGYAENSPQEIVRSSEEWYLSEISQIAQTISDNKNIKIVAIAGPSGSGKTTTAHIMCDRLHEYGENTVVVSLDDFYLPYNDLPILPNGSRDIESVNALDISLIKKCFNEIISSGKTMLPKFNFETKERIKEYAEADIRNKGIVIVEGLHALNPIISDLVPRENIFKIYISVNLPVVDDSGKQILSSRQIRLMRRALRDRIFRNTDINNTLSLWNGVVEGECKFLYCFKHTADINVKTLHFYEPCVYRNDFLALKSDINKDSQCYDYFMKTADALEKFVPIDSSLVPENSLIREFIGNGRYNT